YGVPEEGSMHSRDYFNWDYDRTDLALNQEGDYISSGRQGNILFGSFSADQSGAFSADLAYEIVSCEDQNQHAIFRIIVTGKDGTTKTYSAILQEGENQTSIKNFALQEGDTYQIAVEESEGTTVVLKQIDYYRGE